MVTGSRMDGQVTVMTPAQARNTFTPLILHSMQQLIRSADVDCKCSRKTTLYQLL